MIDLPGTYSLRANSREEEVTRDYIYSNQAQAVVSVCDATALERNLVLLLQIMEKNENVILCLNLMDEAERKGIKIDVEELSKQLGIAVIPTNARGGRGIDELKDAIASFSVAPLKEINKDNSESYEDEQHRIQARATDIFEKTVTFTKRDRHRRDEKIDRVLTGRFLAFPTMLMFLLFLLCITVYLANYPSQLLSVMFTRVETTVHTWLQLANCPPWLLSLVCSGIIRVVGWIVSVMLPPMAIFFPLFTLLEDWGYLPRLAYNLDRPFKKCGTCGKQALTMCMGFGCNAVGVTGCRIIASKKERLIAILTNSLVPCNGRFPTMIALITVFLAGGGVLARFKGALILSLVLIIGVMLTLLVSYVLSRVILKEEKSPFILELPSYRTPVIFKTLIRSLLDRTSYVLLRALCVALPAGIIIWLLANINVGEGTLLFYMSSFLNPLGKILGVDGVILLAFILGLPANEIVMPIALMAYTASNQLVDLGSTEQLGEILVQNGWSIKTAICVITLSLLHSPCLTTLLTIKKETGSIRWTLVAFALPTLLGFLACLIINFFFTLI